MKLKQTLEQFCAPLLIGGSVLSLIVISACHSLSSEATISVGANMPPVFSMRIETHGSEFMQICRSVTARRICHAKED